MRLYFKQTTLAFVYLNATYSDGIIIEVFLPFRY